MKIGRNSWKVNRNISITLVCILLGITLAWQYQSVRKNAKMSDIENQRKDELVTQLLSAKENNDNLRKKNDELNIKIREYESARGDNDANMKLLTNEIEKLRIIAGLKEVRGKGLIVTISKEDAPNVRDYDIFDILNELRATDAQALAINDERVISTTEVRVAGGHIMVNGKQLTAPYVIRAIVDPINAENAFNLMDGPIEKLRVFIDVKLEKSDNVVIPKVRDEVIRTDMLTPVEK